MKVVELGRTGKVNWVFVSSESGDWLTCGDEVELTAESLLGPVTSDGAAALANTVEEAPTDADIVDGWDKSKQKQEIKRKQQNIGCEMCTDWKHGDGKSGSCVRRYKSIDKTVLYAEECIKMVTRSYLTCIKSIFIVPGSISEKKWSELGGNWGKAILIRQTSEGA